MGCTINRICAGLVHCHAQGLTNGCAAPTAEGTQLQVTNLAHPHMIINKNTKYNNMDTVAICFMSVLIIISLAKLDYSLQQILKELKNK